MKSKTLGIFLSLALILSLAAVALPAAPVSAAATNAKVKLVVGGSGGGNSATWDTATGTLPLAPPTGYGAYAAKLNGGTQDGSTYAAVVIPMDGTVTLASITSFKYNFYATSTQGYPHVCFYTHNPSDITKTAEITMFSGGSPYPSQLTGWNEITVNSTTPAATGSSGFFWYGDETAPGTITEGLPNTYTLGTFQTTAPFSTHVIDKIQIEFGWWSAGTPGNCWVDKVQLTAGTIFDYNLEPIAIDKAYYKAGDTVNITVQNANASGTIPVTALSSLPYGPITIACSETGTGTGIFTGSFLLVATTPGTGQLLVSNGNTITVSYTGNWGAGSDTKTTTAIYDSAAPTVALTAAGTSNPTKDSPFVVTATFSEAITGFALGDITVTNGTANTLAGTNPYTFNVVPSGDGLVTVNIPAGGCIDRAGNLNTAATPLTRTSDRTAPTVILSAAAQDPTNASPILVTASFSEAVTGFIATDVTGSNFASPVTSFTDVGGAGTLFTFSVTPTTDGLVTVAIAGSMCTDLALNANTAATDLTRTSDRTVPTVAITSTIGPTGSSTAVTPVPFTATFSEAVTGFVVGDITVTNGTAGSFVDVAGGHTIFTFNVTPTAAGAVTSVTVSIPAARAQDAATNPNTVSTPTPFTFTFNNPNPTTTIISSVGVSGSLTNTSPIPFTVSFSAAVTGFVVGDISVTNGTAGGFTGAGTTYYFSVTPTGQGAVIVNIAAGVCQDTAASRPNLAAAPYTINYDSVGPTVVMAASGGAPWTVTATWNEVLTNGTFTQADLVLTNCNVSSWTLVTTDKVWTFVVTPIAEGTVTVSVPEFSCTDLVLNDNAAPPYAGNPFTRVHTTLPNAIYLDTGWNLISLPLIPTKTAIATVLAGITPTGKVISVWSYNPLGATTALKWPSYTPGAPSDLATMEDGKGYLINMSAPGTLVVSGTVMPVDPLTLPPTYNVSIGYNLIGFKSTAAMDNCVYLTGTSYRFPIYWKEAGVWASPLTKCRTAPATPEAAADMKPGFGYWVYFNAAGTITP
jgi:hypothetical protein